jgi:transcription elongation factor Elf1
MSLSFHNPCHRCGYAYLVKCVLDAREGSEIWTYECADCGRKSERSVKM